MPQSPPQLHLEWFLDPAKRAYKWLHQVPDTSRDPDFQLPTRVAITGAWSGLTPEEQQVVSSVFGLAGGLPMTKSMMATELQLASTTTVTVILDQARAKLQQQLFYAPLEASLKISPALKAVLKKAKIASVREFAPLHRKYTVVLRRLTEPLQDELVGLLYQLGEPEVAEGIVWALSVSRRLEAENRLRL